MSRDPKPPPGPERRSLPLVPRFEGQGYSARQVAERRAWLETTAGVSLTAVGAMGLDPESLRGNVENPIGAAQVPIGVAGPLRVRGETGDRTVYVPLATTEGALVRSYERGMVAVTRAGGAEVVVTRDENQICPLFYLPDLDAALAFARTLEGHWDELSRVVATTTRHGRLLAVEPEIVGREVMVTFRYATGDAQGMNMIAKATDAACAWLVDHSEAERYLLFTGASGEKRPTGRLLAGGKGKRVVATARLPRGVLRSVLRTDAASLVELWRQTVLGHLRAGSFGYNGHLANGLTALFIACGQDVANVANSAVGITSLGAAEEGGLDATVELPSLSVATVGGGTGLATARECLELLGCRGAGKARGLAEIVAATALAGELSMAAALASGDFVAAHEQYGRNRPEG